MALGAVEPFLAAWSSDGDLSVEDVLAVRFLTLNKDQRYVTYHIVKDKATRLRVSLPKKDLTSGCR